MRWIISFQGPFLSYRRNQSAWDCRVACVCVRACVVTRCRKY